MEKIKLNNQVVQMRKYVKKAKVHVINKLVKEIKLLQNRKGNESDILKAKRKAERYLEEISLLKKIKPDYVSKLALSKAKDWNDVLLQKNFVLEDRCIAMLANYGPVQKEVEIFHNTNKDLATKVSDLIKQWEEKNKFCKDLPKKKYSSDLKKLKDLNLQKINSKLNGGLLNINSQSETADYESISKEEKNKNQSINNTHQMKREKRKYKNVENQNEDSGIEPSKFTLSSEKLSDRILHSDDFVENSLKVTESNNNMPNKPKKHFKIIDSKNNYYNDEEWDTKNDSGSEESKSNNEFTSDEENETRKGLDCYEENNSKNDSSARNYSKKENFEHEDIKKNAIERKDFSRESKDIKKLQPEISEFMKDNSSISKSCIKTVSDTEIVNNPQSSPIKVGSIVSNSGENKLKSITMLNLYDLEGLDEIPVNGTLESDLSSGEVVTDDETNDKSEGDPFFLGRDEANSVENKLVGSKSNNYASLNKKSSGSFNYGNIHLQGKNKIFEREKLNYQPNYKKKIQKPLNGTLFSSKHSSKFKNERNIKTCEDKFTSKNYQDKVQYNSKNNFERGENGFHTYKPKKNFVRNNSKNQREFKIKGKISHTHEKNKYNNSNDSYHRSGKDNSFIKSKSSNKRDDANKPLHPSWEAKRKQRELTNTTFQGKKIVFDD